MRALVSKTRLVDSLAIASQVNDVVAFLQVAGATMRVVADTSDGYVSMAFPAVTVVDEGQTAIGLTPLRDVIGLLGGDISVGLEGDTLRIQWERFDASFPTRRHVVLQGHQSPTTEVLLEVSPADLKAACQEASDALPDGSSLMPEGALLEGKADQWHLVSTDGRRMSYSTRSRSAGADFTFVIPSKAVKTIAKLPFASTVSVRFDGRWLWLTDGATEFATGQVAKKFPEWARVVPKASAWSTELPLTPWQTAMRLAGVNMGRDAVIKLTPQHGRLILANTDDVTIASIEAQTTGDMPVLKANLHYLDAATKRADTRVLLQGTGSMNPIVSTNTPYTSHLLMPVK